MPEPVGVIFRRARILEDRHARDDARIIPESLPPTVDDGDSHAFAVYLRQDQPIIVNNVNQIAYFPPIVS
jgi:hypothetical protein